MFLNNDCKRFIVYIGQIGEQDTDIHGVYGNQGYTITMDVRITIKDKST